MESTGFQAPPPSPAQESFGSGSDKITFKNATTFLRFKPTSSAASFIVLSVFCFFVLAFCIVMLSLGSRDNFYFVMIAYIIGLYTPTPKAQRLKNSTVQTTT